MKIGIGLPNVIPGTDGRRLLGWAQGAEELGFDSLGVIDRVVYDSYEPLLALAMAAAVTVRLELVTNVVIAPLRNTVMLAKQAASLDRASGGRLTLGLGLGGRDDDFLACGLPTRGRGRRLDAQLGELRRIWQGTDIGLAPARPGGPRVLLGGGARHAGPRAARHGDGWTMMVGTPADFATGVEVVRDCWTAAGRPGRPATMAVFYAALGDDAPQLVEQAVGGYYAWLGRDVAGSIVETAATSEAQVHELLAGFAAAGADEVMVLPCAADSIQLERLAAVAVPGPLRDHHPQLERPAGVPDRDAAHQAWHPGFENVAPAPSSGHEHRRPRAGPPSVSPTARPSSIEHLIPGFRRKKESVMPTSQIPTSDPVPVAPETWLIPNLSAAGPGRYLPVNSLLIRGSEPVIVDTGAPVHRVRWLEQVFSLVDPEDVRWIFLSHDDSDHVGGLADALAMCPSATVVTNFFATERLSLERSLPIRRLRWLEPGDSFLAGDRRMRLVLPPIFDGPTTRGLFDERSGVLWAVDSFAALTTGSVHHREDVPDDLYGESFALLNSLVSPWHQWLDPARYGRHVDAVADLRPDTVASAHGPLLTGDAIGDAFDRVRAMAAVPRVLPPGQSTLDELVAATVLGPATA